MARLRDQKNQAIEEAVEGIKEAVENPSPRREDTSVYTADDLVPTGSTLLNLALSGHPKGGYRLGTMVNIIGGRSSGKSLLALTMFAEVVKDKRFDNYSFLYDETEAAMFFDKASMFGEGMDRIRFDIRSHTVQDWSENLMSFWGVDKDISKKIKAKKIPSLIHVTDSFDALSTDGELGDTRPGKGGYRVEKPLVVSTTFPKLCQSMEASRSLLLIISQTRSSLAMFGNPECRSGGHALDFYESHEVWLKPIGKIKETVRGQEIVIGNTVRVRVEKNKLTGKRREIEIDILDDYGIDDIGSCIDWMVKFGFWGINKKVIDTGGDLDLPTAKRGTLIKEIEQNNMEEDFRKIVTECWAEVEKELDSKLDRKARYR